MFTALARGGLRLLAAAGGDNFHFRPFGQAVNPVGDHAIPGGKPGADDHFLAVLDPRGDAVFADLILIVQHPYKMPFVAHLQSGGRDDYRVLLGVHQQAGVNELVGEQGVVQIAEARLQLDGPGGRIDLVVEAQQLPDADFLLIGTVPGFDAERFTRFLRLHHRGDAVFRQGKDHVDRMRLGENHNPGGIPAGNLVADIDLL